MSEIKNINLNKVEVQLADTDDPVALKVSWDPANRGGANFKTENMRVSGHCIAIERSAGALLFALVFAVPGIVALLVGSPYFFIKGNVYAGFFMIAWGASFGAAGILMLRSGKCLTFDQLKGSYFRGKQYGQLNTPDREQQGRLSDIYAIQLINERIQSSSSNNGSSSYMSYELNLVFKDGGRLNVMDHGDGDAIDKSAIELGKFLNVPIWKAHY
jgi:hypothetical protein